MVPLKDAFPSETPEQTAIAEVDKANALLAEQDSMNRQYPGSVPEQDAEDLLGITPEEAKKLPKAFFTDRTFTGAGIVKVLLERMRDPNYTPTEIEKEWMRGVPSWYINGAYDPANPTPLDVFKQAGRQQLIESAKRQRAASMGASGAAMGGTRK